MSNLNTFSILVLFFTLFISLNANGQGTIGDIDPTPDDPILSQPHGTNMISCDAYGSITYNGHTIEEFNATKGDPTDLKQLVGPPTSVNMENSIIGEVVYIYNGNRVTFGESVLGAMIITNSDWPITVLGKHVSVGTSFSSLQQKFGSNLKILPGTFNNPEADYAVGFNCNINEADGIHIALNSETDKVIQIKYWVNP